MIVSERLFDARDALAADLAEAVAQALELTLKARAAATLAVSGGSTPALFFERLSRHELDWRKVTITLVDERQVPDSSERSNARLVQAALLKNNAAAARFVPLYQNQDEASALSPDVVVLGMGNDGHTASFFPGGDTLEEAIDPNTTQRLIAVEAPGAGEPRLTFTLPVLLQASAIFLHVEGDDKRAALSKALQPGPISKMPIRAVLRNPKPIILYWCP